MTSNVKTSRIGPRAARSNHRESGLTLHSAVPVDLRHLHGQRGVETPARTPARRRAPFSARSEKPSIGIRPLLEFCFQHRIWLFGRQSLKPHRVVEVDVDHSHNRFAAPSSSTR